LFPCAGRRIGILGEKSLEEKRGEPVSRRIYLDFNASTPICPEALGAMRPFLFEHYGNPSSLHWAGMPGKEAVEKARGQVAGLLGCDPTEVVFTSGGSESNNHAIKGVFFANRNRGDHILTTAVEHPATINPCQFLEKLGAKVTVLPVDRFGMVDPNDLRKAITPRTILITVMHANNEVGTIEPIPEFSTIAREAGITSHTDAAQTVWTSSRWPATRCTLRRGSVRSTSGRGQA
jgi:cysteine desulfurase